MRPHHRQIMRKLEISYREQILPRIPINCMKCEFNSHIHDEILIETPFKMGFFEILYRIHGYRKLSPHDPLLHC